MNIQRRKRIKAIVSQLTDAQNALDMVRYEEQEAYANLPEGLQDSERGERMLDCADELDSVSDDLGNIIDELNELLNTY